MRTINYTVSYEKLISRLPALFAFLEIDEQGTCDIVSAINGKQGNYGKIVANINIPDEFEFEYTCKDGKILKVSEGWKQYRTLIDVYYKALSDKEWERDDKGIYKEPFLAFMERGIGLKYVGLSKVETDETVCGKKQYKSYPLAPDYIYLGEAKTLYNKMIKMKKQIDFYESHVSTCKDDEKYYFFLNQEFEMHNGEALLEKLDELITEAEKVAEEYLGYAKTDDQEKEGLSLKFNINLTNTIKDLGMVTPTVQEWVAGKRYYNEDVVYYVDENGYGMTWKCIVGEKEKVKQDSFGRNYTEGFYDEKTELISFDKDNWKAQSLNCADKNPTVETKGDNQIKIKGTCNSHLQSLRRFSTYLNHYDEVEMPNNYKDWLWFYRVGVVTNREEKYDEMGNLAVMYPNNGTCFDGIEAIVGGDKPSNIKTVGDYVTNLAVWGDVITKIEAKNNEEDGIGEITFEYWLGVHIKAKQDGFSEDEDGNYKYYFTDFTPDFDSNQGVKYTEKYIYYKDSEIWDLVEKGKDKENDDEKPFNHYINGGYDKDYKPTNDDEITKFKYGENYYKLYEKMEFDTSINIQEYEIKIGNRNNKVPYLVTDFETVVDITHLDIEDSPLIRYDYYNGVNFQPIVNDDVYVERGVTQAFEKHIKFGEIKTFEDLENYANGGFFSISKEDIDLG